MEYVLLILTAFSSAAISLLLKSVGTVPGKRHLLFLNAITAFSYALSSFFLTLPHPEKIFSVSPYTLCLSLFYALSLLCMQLFQAKAYGTGSTSVTAMLYSLGFLLPIAYGAVFLNESIHPLQYVGVCVLLPALYFLIHPQKGEKKSKNRALWLLFTFLALFFSGLSAILQKQHQFSDFREELSVFAFLGAFFAAIFSLFPLFFSHRDTQDKHSLHKFFPDTKRLLLAPFFVGVLKTFVGWSFLFLATRLPSVVMFPVCNMGGMILTGILGSLIFREKPGKFQLIGMGIGLVAILLIGMG